MLKAYDRQLRNAKRRNIPWEFTYETWIKWWKETGKLEKRGTYKDQYCMCRINDVGPYSPSNVYCSTNAENVRFANKLNGTTWRLNAEQRARITSLGGKAAAKVQLDKSKKLFEDRLELLQTIDFNKRGAIKAASELIGTSRGQISKYLKRFPELLLH